MRPWIVLLAASAFGTAAAMGGCSGNNVVSGDPSSSVSVGTGIDDPNLGCENNAPNGECNLRSANPEACTCPDCVEAASCRGTCNDDGACSYVPGAEMNDEDCSCDDCYGKHGACPPFGGFCNNDEPGCQTGEACTCPDCQGAEPAHCGCDNNGQCVEALEGCSCGDCAGVVENCGGNPTTTTTTNSGGGMGGMGGAGMGGAGGAGGAGGM